MRKTVFALAAAFILLTTFGCGKDGGDSKPSIVGKWTATSADYKEYEDNVLKFNVTQNYTGDPYYEFLSDGTLNVKDEDGETSSTTYTYNPDTKVLTAADTDDDETITVTQLTSSQLTLHEEFVYTEDNINYKEVIDVHLKK